MVVASMYLTFWWSSLFFTCVLCLITQLCPTLWDPIDWAGSSVHGDPPGKNSGVGCHALLQGIFLTQGSNPGLPHCRRILYYLSHQGTTGLHPSPLIDPQLESFQLKKPKQTKHLQPQYPCSCCLLTRACSLSLLPFGAKLLESTVSFPTPSAPDVG